jgi:hypothetical protein
MVINLWKLAGTPNFPADFIYLRQPPQGEVVTWEFKVFTRDNVKRSGFIDANLNLLFPPGKSADFLREVMSCPGLLKSVLAAKFPEIGQKIDLQNHSELIRIEPDIEIQNFASKFTVARY